LRSLDDNRARPAESFDGRTSKTISDVSPVREETLRRMNASDQGDARETERWKAAAEQDLCALTESDDPTRVTRDPGPDTIAEAVFRPPSETVAGPEPTDFVTIHSGEDSRVAGPIDETIPSRVLAAGDLELTYPGRLRPAPTLMGYQILGELGRGGMGVVYKARQIRLNRICALKMVLAGSHADGPASLRFQTEAESIAQLQHPNVVQIFSIGEAAGLPYLELEYLEGGSLQQKLDGTPWPPEKAARLVEALGRGVAAAHSRGLIHRDLKPGNVLLTAQGVPKVADFGLAKALEGSNNVTASGSILGSPSYMAPEQADGLGKDVGPAADVYGLGAILYELLTGRPPFRGATVFQTLEQVRMAEPVRPGRLVPGLPRDIETIAVKCLEKKATDRYASAEALTEDLRRFAAGEPIFARPVSMPERSLKWARRRPWIAALVSALSLALVGLLTLGIWSYWRINKALGDAQKSRTAAIAETYRAMLNETRALRLARPAGWRRSALENLALMAATETRGRDRVELRTEAVSCLGQIDVREVARFEGLQGVRSLEFSPDGGTLATADYGGRLRLWDVARLQHLQVVDDPAVDYPLQYTEEAPMPVVRFEPGGGGLVYATWNRRVEWLDPSRPTTNRPSIEGPSQPCSMGFDRLGRRLAIAWTDGWITLHDAKSGARQRTIAAPTGRPFNPVAISPDGQWIAGMGAEYRVQLYRADGSDESKPLGRHAEHVRSLEFSPDGKTLASASIDNTAKLWDVDRAEERLALRGHTARLNGVAYHPDGDLIATASDDETVRLWDARSGVLLLVIRPGVGSVLSVAFSPDGAHLACGHDSVCLYTISGLREQRQLRGHTYEIFDVAFGADGRQVVSGSNNHQVIGWDSNSGRTLWNWNCDPGRVRPLESLALSPVDRLVAVGPGTYDGVELNPDFSVLLWDPNSGPVGGRALHGQESPVVAVAIDSHGRRLASGGRDGHVIVWDLATDKTVSDTRLGNSPIASLAFLNGGRSVIAGDRDGDIRIEDLEGGSQARHVHVEGGVARFAVSREDDVIVVGGNTGDLTVLQLPQLTTTLRLEKAHSGSIRGVALGPDRSFLVTGADDHRIVIRDMRTLREIFAFPPHDGAVYRLALSPDGSRLAIAGVEQRLALWDLTTLGRGLSEIGLPWREGEAVPPPYRDAASPITVEGPPSAVDRAWSFMGRGESLRSQGQTEQALELYGEATKAWEAILRDRPSIPFFRAELAVSLAAIAEIQHDSGRGAEAARSLDQAMKMILPLRDYDACIAFNQSRVLALASKVMADQRKPLADRALAALRQALAGGYKDRRQLDQNPDLDPLRARDDFEGVVRRDPTKWGWPFLLMRGQARARQGLFAEALADSAKARDMLRELVAISADDVWLRRHWIESCVDVAAVGRKTGRNPREADDLSQAIGNLEAIPDRDKRHELVLARAHALLADGGESDHATRAFTSLRRAIKLGLDDGSSLQSDTAFDGLRETPEFQALVRELSLPNVHTSNPTSSR
jgi:eukaryotic-like serine/threonine-protein kinase